MTITFPATPLVASAYIARNADLTAAPGTWSWTDISDYVRHDASVRLRMHRQNEGGYASTCTATATLDNRDGRFSRRNPYGAYFGTLTMNTPIYFTLDSGEGEKVRYQGFVNEWPTAWDISATDSTVTIRCSGVLRRLSTTTALTQSSLRRYIPTWSPLAYWPCEDGAESTTIASAIPGGRPMVVAHGAAVHAGAIGPPGSDNLIDVSTNAILTGRVPRAGGTSSYRIDFMVKVEPMSLGEVVCLLRWKTTGAVVQWELLSNPGASSGGLYLYYTFADPALGSGSTAPFADIDDGQWHHIWIYWAYTGSDVDIICYIDNVLHGPQTRTVGVIGDIYEIGVNGGSSADTSIASIGHITIYAPIPAATILYYEASQGFAGEQAHERIERLCDELQIPFTTSATTSQTVGPEGTGSPLSRMREAEAADGGILYETGFGLGYLSINERYNAATRMDIDFDQGQIAGVPRPADDDQRVRNRWRVTRPLGSEATEQVVDGPLGTGPQGPGVYEGTAFVNVEDDSQLPDQAGWRAHLGTIDEDRWPAIPLRFHRSPELIPDFVLMKAGSRITIANPPAQMAPDVIDAVVEGWTERWDTVSWDATLNTSPFRPYRVGTLATTSGDTSEYLMRLVPDVCDLVDAVNPSATSWLVVSDPPWTTTADDFPIDMRFGGEVVTLTAVAPIATDSFTRTVAAGSWGSATSGQAYTLVGTAADYSVNGTRGRVAPATLASDYKATIDVGHHDVNLTADVRNETTPASGTVRIGLIGRYASGSNYYHAEMQVATDGRVTLRILKRVGGTATTLATVTTGLVNPGGTFKTMRFAVVGDRLRARIWPLGDSEPLLWMIDIEDTSLTSGDSAGFFVRNDTASTAHVFLVDGLTVAEPKTWTVTRSVNGVSKSHSALTAGEIDDPGVLGL